MENDEVFVADAKVDPRLQLRSQSFRRGQDLAEAASGGIRGHRNSRDETAPLMGKRRRNSESTSESPNTDEDTSTAEWSGAKDFEGRPWWRTPSVFWLFPGFVLQTLSFGGILVPRINMIIQLICKEYFSDQSIMNPSFHFMPVILGDDNPQCQVPEVQALVSRFNLYGSLISGLLSALVSPKLGALSDQYGRLKIIAISIVGALISEAIFIVAAMYPNMFSVWWILVGFVFDGLCGSFTTAMAMVFAYASDCTHPKRRSVVFGRFHACLFGGIALGPLIAGWIVKKTGRILLIFYISLGCHCFYLLIMLFVIPESLSEKRRRSAKEKRMETSDSEDLRPQSLHDKILSTSKRLNILAPLAVLYPEDEGSSSALRRNLILLASVDTTMFGVAMGSMSVVIIYSELTFRWQTFESSIFVSVVNTCRVAVLLVLLPLISRILRGPKSTAIQQNSGSDRIDLSIIRVAIAFDLLGYIGYATAHTGLLFILAGVITALGGMGPPTLQAALTKHVPHHRTGEVLGAMGLLHSLARVVGPTVFNLIYSLTVIHCPQTVFISLAAAFAIAFVISWFIRPYVHWDKTPSSDQT